MKAELIAAVRAVSLEPIEVRLRTTRRLHIFCALSGADIDTVVDDLLGATAENLLDPADVFSWESAQRYGAWPNLTPSEWIERLQLAGQVVGL